MSNRKYHCEKLFEEYQVLFYCPQIMATLAARLPQLSPAALSLAHGLLHYDPSARLSATDALQHDYFTHEAPAPEQPAQVLHALHGEWHEMQSKHAHRRRHAT